MSGSGPASLSGQVALITGASRGIGRAIAVEFAKAGAAVVLLARSTEGSPGRLPGTVDETAREVEAAGGTALAVPADVRNEEEVAEAVRRALEAFGRVDVLVNNAAVFFGAPFHEVPLRRWDLVLDVNLRGVAICCRALIPSMIEKGAARIINVSSSVAAELHPGMAPYAVSKAGVETLTRYLAWELREHGIAANVLRIDRAVATEGARRVNSDDGVEWVSPQEAALSALWLARQPASYSGRTVIMSEISGTPRGEQ